MRGTKSFKMKNRFDYLHSLGSKRKYGRLVSTWIGTFWKFFHFEFPCKVTVYTNTCGITKVVLRSQNTEITFESPRFKNTSYHFSNISEKLFTINQNGGSYLKEVFTVGNTGFFFSNCCETAEGKYRRSPELSLPYTHECHDVWVDFKYPIMDTPDNRLTQRYIEAIEVLKIFLQERKTFNFQELLNNVVSTLEVPIENIEKVDITNFLLYSGGKIYTATSRNESSDFVTFSNDKNTASYISSEFRLDLDLGTQTIVMTPLTDKEISEETKGKWQGMALSAIDSFMAEVKAFNKV